jgi:hypothetical protein
MITRRLKPRRGRILDPDFLRFARTQPCSVPGCKPGFKAGPIEAAHVGRRGIGQKCSDREVLPLCARLHHQVGVKSHHALGKRFWVVHGLNRAVLIAELNRLYELESS